RYPRSCSLQAVVGPWLDEDMVAADAYIEDLATFITASPSSYHAAWEVARRLDEAGFTQREETEEWPATAGGYYVLRDGAVIAWYQPEDAGPTSGFRILGAHTDSPGFKLKPRPSTGAFGWLQAGVEIYGGPLLNSWLDRDLELAGRLVTADGSEHLVRTGPLLRIPQLAIHRDREEIGRASCRGRRSRGTWSRARDTRSTRDWSSDVCSSDLPVPERSVGCRRESRSTVARC